MEVLRIIILEGIVKEDKRFYDNVKTFAEDEPLHNLEMVGLIFTTLELPIQSVMRKMDKEGQCVFLKDVVEKLEMSCDGTDPMVVTYDSIINENNN